jgi:hypothetical protein
MRYSSCRVGYCRPFSMLALQECLRRGTYLPALAICRSQRRIQLKLGIAAIIHGIHEKHLDHMYRLGEPQGFGRSRSRLDMHPIHHVVGHQAYERSDTKDAGKILLRCCRQPYPSSIFLSGRDSIHIVRRGGWARFSDLRVSISTQTGDVPSQSSRIEKST